MVARGFMTEPSDKQLRRRQDRRRLVQLLSILAVALIVGRCVGARGPVSGQDEFKSAKLEALNKLEAPYVLIGNSMLGTRIDPATLSKELGGEPVELLRSGGSASALWYLQFKNYVVASETQPKRVVIFFRDEFLTRPLYRTSGKYTKYISQASHREEPVFNLVMAGVQRDWRFDMHEFVKTRVPLYRYREPMERGLDRMGALSQNICCKTRDASEILSVVNGLFKVDKLRKLKEGDTVSKTPSKLSFEEVVGPSFLPQILRLAEEHDISLYFVRVQRRPPTKTTAELGRYIEDLAGYLEDRGAGFVDLNVGETAPLTWYGKGDHIAPESRKQYTAWFRTRANEIFADSK